MTRTYAEMFYLFFRFHERRSVPNPLLSAGSVLVALQLLCFVDIVLILSSAGLLPHVIPRYRIVVINAAAVLSLLNFLILRGGTAQRFAALVRESSLGRARWALAAIACATLFTMLLYKGVL